MTDHTTKAPVAGIRKAMVFAAGLGTRLKPWTDHHPKALARVNGKSLLQRNIEYLQVQGIYEVVVNVHHFADQITNEIAASNGWGSQITLSDETDAVLETGGGLQKAAGYFSDVSDFVVMNVDILTDMPLAKMISQHLHNQPLATLAVSERETSRYFLFDEQQYLSGWENSRTGEKKIVRNAVNLRRKAFSGIHVINSAYFHLIQLTGKFSMVDAYLALAKHNNISCFDHSGCHFLDVGKPESIVAAEKIFP